MFKPMILAFAATALLGSASGALAQASGRSAVGSFTFTLTDLNPGDGITPSLVFDPLPFVPPPGQAIGGPYIDASLYDDGYALNHFQEGSGTAPLSHSFSVPGAAAVDVSLSGRELPGTHRIEFSAFAHGNGINEVHGAGGGAHFGAMPFTLSPHTAVTFSLLVEVEASVLGGTGAVEFYDTFVQLTLATGTYTDADFVDSDHTVILVMDAYGLDTSIDISETLQVSYSNETADFQRGLTSVDLWATASSTPLVIPEPGTLPMLLGGLLVISAWGARGRGRPTR